MHRRIMFFLPQVEADETGSRRLPERQEAEGLEPVLAFDPAYAHPKRFVPPFGSPLRESMRGVVLPGRDGFKARPIRHRNADFLPCAFEPQKTGLRRREFEHAPGGFCIPAVSIMSDRGKNHREVGWRGGFCWARHRNSVIPLPSVHSATSFLRSATSACALRLPPSACEHAPCMNTMTRVRGSA